jgi:hypothetical protein
MGYISEKYLLFPFRLCLIPEKTALRLLKEMFEGGYRLHQELLL